jgi:uncharacterized protein YqfA (UPF0365 family)
VTREATVNGNQVFVVVAAVMALVFFVFLVLFFSVLRLWIQALLTGTPISIVEIIGLRLRRIPPQLIVQAAITLAQRGVKVPTREIVDCYLKHGADRDMNATQLATLVVAERADSPNPPQT